MFEEKNIKILRINYAFSWNLVGCRHLFKKNKKQFKVKRIATLSSSAKSPLESNSNEFKSNIPQIRLGWRSIATPLTSKVETPLTPKGWDANPRQGVYAKLNEKRSKLIEATTNYSYRNLVLNEKKRWTLVANPKSIFAIIRNMLLR